MSRDIILASGSDIRAKLLENAGIRAEVVRPRVDEEMLKAALKAEGATPQDTADALAEAKARKVGMKHLDKLVIGCDQVLDASGSLLSKPKNKDEACVQLAQLSGARHMLLSACVLYHEGKPIWRHVGRVRLTMRKLGEPYMNDYVERNWESIRHSVGAYKLEEEGVRLFSHIEGDYFTILGLPLIELINYLVIAGDLEG